LSATGIPASHIQDDRTPVRVFGKVSASAGFVVGASSNLDCVRPGAWRRIGPRSRPRATVCLLSLGAAARPLCGARRRRHPCRRGAGRRCHAGRPRGRWLASVPALGPVSPPAPPVHSFSCGRSHFNRDTRKGTSDHLPVVTTLEYWGAAPYSPSTPSCSGGWGRQRRIRRRPLVARLSSGGWAGRRLIGFRDRRSASPDWRVHGGSRRFDGLR
jgi:hypothetical protein